MAKSSTSFGHKVEVLTDDQARWWDSANNCYGQRWACAKCKAAPSAFGISFNYVTGKSGRVTDRWQAVCPECAIKFASKHGLTIPEDDLRCIMAARKLAATPQLTVDDMQTARAAFASGRIPFVVQDVD